MSVATPGKYHGEVYEYRIDEEEMSMTSKGNMENAPGAQGKPPSGIAALTAELESLWRRRRGLLVRDGLIDPATDLSAPGEPAAECDIQAVEDFYKVKLPLDYVEFMKLHNGWAGLDYDLLSTGQMLRGELYDYVGKIKEVWRLEGDAVLPEGIPIYAGQDLRAFTFFDRHTNPMKVRDYTDNLEYPSFSAYLENWVTSFKKWIREEE